MEVLKMLSSVQLSLIDLTKRVDSLSRKLDGAGLQEAIGDGMPCRLPAQNIHALMDTLEGWVGSCKTNRMKLVLSISYMLIQ